jgi:1,2-diacylglycerol 3-beta-glucosyltransferase
MIRPEKTTTGLSEITSFLIFPYILPMLTLRIDIGRILSKSLKEMTIFVTMEAALEFIAMPASFLPEDNSFDGSEILPVLQLLDRDIREYISETLQGYPKGQGRRRKAALLLVLVWSCVIVLHLSSIGVWVVAGIATLMGAHLVKLFGTSPTSAPIPLAPDLAPETYPFVSLLVAAKDEEAVIQSLVETLCTLDYPSSRYELWVVDDNSSDRTPKVLAELALRYPHFHWLRRPSGSSGGKSGALNQVLPLTKGDIIGVFDADAQVPKDLLRHVLPYFDGPTMGAVQVRKAIANANTNFWTRGQSIEMTLDAFLQERRSAIGGIGELRGNGQFVRRTALERCGGWNEDTITDDLDLTLRLHLDLWDIGLMLSPVVNEEGVTRMMGLWHQRNRWAEGGYQRYLDYWPLLLKNRLGYRKSIDLIVFLTLQYLLPAATIPDTALSLLRGQLPVLLPLSSLTMALSFIGMFAGLNRIRRGQNLPFQLFPTLFQSILGTLYMFHWFVVVSSVTARMAFRAKRFNWVKTLHVGPSVTPTC